MEYRPHIEEGLRQLGLGVDEIKIFVSLVNAPKNHLSISRDTDIARSNVYRIVDNLIEKGVVYGLTTDSGKTLVAANTDALELLVARQEAAAKKSRSILDVLLPTLETMQGQGDNFAIHTYKGVSGVRQMLWNELKSESEILIFSGGPLEPVTGRSWSERFREEIVKRDIQQRGLENGSVDMSEISETSGYDEHYTYRHLPKSVLDITVEITIHDDFVSLYNARTSDVQLGTEVKNPLLAAFMRQVFEGYWNMAQA